MPPERLIFERDYDLPPVIVWDAFVDPVLVEGWLAPAQIEAILGGQYRLDWVAPVSGTTSAVVRRIEPLRRLVIEAGDDILDFSLTELDGGTRGTATRVTVGVSGLDDPLVEAALWRVRLSQLENLLRGHPVDWEHWNRDRGEDWRRSLAEAATGDGR